MSGNLEFRPREFVGTEGFVQVNKPASFFSRDTFNVYRADLSAPSGETMPAAIKVLPKYDELLRQILDRDYLNLQEFYREDEINPIFPRPLNKFDEVVNGERYYGFAMEFIPGNILSDQIKSGISYESAIGMGKALLDVMVRVEGFSASPDDALIMCDLSPENIMYNPETEKFRLIDLGLTLRQHEVASLLTGGEMWGRLYYASPEQVRWSEFSKGVPLLHDSIDARLNIYLLGEVLYELFAPHSVKELTKKNAQSTLTEINNFILSGRKNAIMREELEALGNIPQSLIEVILRAVSVDREERYGNMQEFRDAFNSALSSSRRLSN